MPPETPAPEPSSPSPFASTPAATEVLQKLGQGMGVRKPLLLVTGESGMGKTPLVGAAIAKLGERATIAWMLEPHLDAKELLPKVLELFGGTTRPGTSPLAHAERLLMALANATSGGRIAMLVVDDAHALSDEVLLELQRVADKSAQRQCPLEIVLVGQPALAKRLAEPALAAVNAQISTRIELPALNAHHTRRYLLLLPAPAGASHPPQYSRKACRDIHTASRGVPRDIEALAAESARLAASANSTVVSPEHVRAAVQALGSRPAPKPAAPIAAPKPAPAEAKPVAVAKPKAEAKKPEPAPAAAPKEPEAVKPGGSSADVAGSADERPDGITTPSGTFVSSDDPRVKSWVARFGGSGVRMGGMYTGSVPDEPVESASSASFGATRSYKNDMGDTPPMASAGGSLDVRGEVTWPPPRSASRAKKGPVLGKRSGSNGLWQAVALLLAIALGAVVFMQRRAANAVPSKVTKSNATAPQEQQKEAVPKEESALPEKPSTPRAAATPRPKPEDRKLASSAATTTPARTDRKTTPDTRKPETKAVASERTDPSQLVTKSRKGRELELAKTGRAYTILVGSFLKSDMAFAEREHLSRLTNHPVWVSKRTINGVRTYRIILGAFESGEIAENAAQSLLQRGLIRDAKVLSLPLE